MEIDKYLKLRTPQFYFIFDTRWKYWTPYLEPY